MRPLRKLWPALEALPGLAAVTEEWRELLGEDFGAGQELLRLTNRRAEAYPCPSPGGIGCSRSIVEHGNGRIVAVCGDQPKRCDRVTLNKQDIAIYELDTRKLGTAIAVAFGVDPDFNEVTGLQQTYRVGDYHPQAGKRFPLFLTIQTDPASLRDVTTRLCAATDTAFILVVPTSRFSDLAMVDLLGRQKARGTALADLFENDGAKKLVATKAAKTLIAEFHEAVLPNEDKGPPEKFPTPPDAIWSDVVIKFEDGHRVSVRCKSKTGVFNYTQMGMADRRNGNPDVQWQFLWDLSDGHGKMSSTSRRADRKNVKRKQGLDERLRAFFGINEEAVTWDDDASEYRCRFQLSPD
jgi:hypothetical protein